MVDIAGLEYDESKLEDGVWKTVTTDVGDIEVLFRSPLSEQVKIAKRRAEKPYLSKIRKNTLSLEEQAKIFIDTLIEGAILDWDLEYQGQPLAWSKEVGRKFLKDKRFDKLAAALIAAFFDTDGFLVDLEEDGGKNSLSASNGNPTGKIQQLA